MPRDLYEILGISHSASDDEIKRAYRKLAQKYHPDKNQGNKDAEKKFKEINGAYQVLSDKKKRQTYDQFGDAAFYGGGGGGGTQGFPGGFDFGGFGDLGGFGESFADIFETFFSGSASRSRSRSSGPAHGADREAAITVSFEEAAFGTEKEVKINKIGECDSCKGKGSAPGSKIITCPACNGAGEIRRVQQTVLGQVTTRRVCDSCRGEGKMPERPCSACHGASRMRVSEKLKVKIPAGITDGSSIRLAGKGDSGMRGGQAGDLYVHINIAPNKYFQRREADVFSEQEIHLLQAVLGDTIDIRTVHGGVKLRLPAGTGHGKIFRLKGYGVQKLRSSGKGDHFVTINIKIPEKLSKKQRELYKQLADEEGLKIEERKGIFDF